MRLIVSTAALTDDMAAATDEQLRLLRLYGKSYAVRAAQREAAKRARANPKEVRPWR